MRFQVASKPEEIRHKEEINDIYYCLHSRLMTMQQRNYIDRIGKQIIP